MSTHAFALVEEALLRHGTYLKHIGIACEPNDAKARLFETNANKFTKRNQRLTIYNPYQEIYIHSDGANIYQDILQKIQQKSNKSTFLAELKKMQLSNGSKKNLAQYLIKHDNILSKRRYVMRKSYSSQTLSMHKALDYLSKDNDMLQVIETPSTTIFKNQLVTIKSEKENLIELRRHTNKIPFK